MPATTPIDLIVRGVIADELPEFYPRAVARAALAGRFTLDDGMEALARIQAQRRAPRPVGQPRPSPRDRPWQDAGARYTPELGLDATLNVRGTAHRVLSLVASLAGRAGSIDTLTCSIAAALGASRRCIQYAYRTLVAAGLIEHTVNRRTNIVTITVLPAARPRPPTPPEQGTVAAPWPIPPTASTAWLDAFRARCARVARVFAPVPAGGAQRRAPINSTQ